MDEKMMMVKRYEKEVGPVRNLPKDHPYRWQWEYRGTKEEREELLEHLAGKSEEQVAHMQESLLDG
jgi:hypothetical protein